MYRTSWKVQADDQPFDKWAKPDVFVEFCELVVDENWPDCVQYSKQATLYVYIRKTDTWHAQDRVYA